MLSRKFLVAMVIVALVMALQVEEGEADAPRKHGAKRPGGEARKGWYKLLVSVDFKINGVVRGINMVPQYLSFLKRPAFTLNCTMQTKRKKVCLLYFRTLI